MKKIAVSMAILASVVANTISASTPESKKVSVCLIDEYNLLVFAKEKILCSGDYEGKTNILKMYKNNWEIKSTFVFKDKTYLIFEKTN